MLGLATGTEAGEFRIERYGERVLEARGATDLVDPQDPVAKIHWKTIKSSLSPLCKTVKDWTHQDQDSLGFLRCVGWLLEDA